MKTIYTLHFSSGPSQSYESESEAKNALWEQAKTGESRYVTHISTANIAPPVDRSVRCTTDGKPLDTTPVPGGQQSNYVVLCEEERTKGLVRPVRRTYIHVGVDPEMNGIVLIKPGWTIEKQGKRACGTRTTMGLAIAETYARDPGFYTGTFCASCGEHFPVGEFGEFIWEGTTERVGT